MNSLRIQFYRLASSLTNRLMIRVTDYFETQLRVPFVKRKEESIHTEPDVPIRIEPGTYNDIFHISEHSHKAMSEEQMVSWFGKVLTSVRLRSRKLLRYVRYVYVGQGELWFEHFLGF